MAPRTARSVIAALVLVIAASVAYVVVRGGGSGSSTAPDASGAVLPTSQRARVPELVRPAGFLNSAPFTIASLRGKVVLVDFWTYSCINCQRTFPFLRAWYERYRADGFVIVGVHSPEFDFERDPANVARAVARYQVTWPVVLDPGMETWDAFTNRYWPAEYLVDRQGRVARTHFGEGEYATEELAIRQLLGIAGAGPTVTEPPSPFRADQTPETYLGYLNGDLSQPSGFVHDTAFTYTLPAAPPAIGFAIGGRWRAGPESLAVAGPDATLVVRFRARLVHLVAQGPADVVVTLDDAPVPADQRPAAMTVRADGATVIHVAGPDLYTVLDGAKYRSGVLAIRSTGPPLAVFSFTFGA